MRARKGASADPSPGNADRIDPLAAAARRSHREWSEFGWGGGLTPAGLEDIGPAQGGRYHTRVAGTIIRNRL